MCDKRLCACEPKKPSKSPADLSGKNLEDSFVRFLESESPSMLKKYLTRDVFDTLKNRFTSYGSGLRDVIQSGLANPDSGIGVYAPDPESYETFRELFDPIIHDYHAGFRSMDVQPKLEWGDGELLGDLDPTGKYVVSTRVRCGRSLKGFPFNPTMKEAHYRDIQTKVSKALESLDGELQGKYHPLEGMDKQTQQTLIDEHFLFKEGDRFLQAANACRYWPVGRGIFYNKAKTFLVWCNEEDHIRVISMEKGGNLSSTYGRLVRAMNKLGKMLEFSSDNRLGFLTFCPTNLGTTIRASVHIKLPKLSADFPKLLEIAETYHLQVRGTRGEHSDSEGGIYDISNKRRIGLTEFEALVEMRDGIRELITMEQILNEEYRQSDAR
ncbi:arginine kinase-like [Venturia canescens]|uniref:arginine kinase-like n=1 Tax=Venturia canescens TaxID=32260 RepID=UPI001C9C3AA5|nr:arginine kinase-like [Venturia canescens]